MPTPAPLSANYGSLNKPFVDVKRDYGAQGDGVSDDTQALQNAINEAANNFGAGTVWLDPGTYLVSGLTLKSQVHLRGSGIEATIIKLKNGANGDLLSASMGLIALGAAFGSGSTGGIFNWSIKDITLDGNKSNQSGTSYGLRFYGYGFVLENVRVRNCLTDGLLCDWNGGTTSPGQDNVGAQFINTKFHDHNGAGLRLGGPYNSQFLNLEIFNNGLHGLHLAPNARGCLFSNLLSYGAAQGVTNGAIPLLCEANNVHFVNVLAQDSDTVQVVLLGNENLFIGRIIGGTGNATTAGVQIGQGSGNQPYNGMIDQSAGTTTAQAPIGILVEGIIDSCLGSNGSFWVANDGGQTRANITCKQASGSQVTGTIANSSIIYTGATPSLGTVSASSPALSNGGTVSTNAAIARVTPATAVTGIILQAGIVPGQQVFVDNQGSAANTITWNTTPATSHVANAATATAIAGLTGRLYTWDGAFWVQTA